MVTFMIICWIGGVIGTMTMLVMICGCGAAKADMPERKEKPQEGEIITEDWF